MIIIINHNQSQIDRGTLAFWERQSTTIMKHFEAQSRSMTGIDTREKSDINSDGRTSKRPTAHPQENIAQSDKHTPHTISQI